jgi:hypothetical protein
MARDTSYPLPMQLSTELEMALGKVPDRGDTVHTLRRLAGRIYAEGHQDGRFVGMEEMRRDYRYESEVEHRKAKPIAGGSL